MLPYLLSLALVAAGLLVLALVGVRVVGGLRRLRAVQVSAAATVRDRSGLLRARSAALRVAIKAPRGDQSDDLPGRVPSGKPVTTGGRP